MATHGLQGAVVLTHILGKSGWLKNDDTLFVAMYAESYIPFFVVSAKAANDEEYIVQLEDLGTVEAARKLIGKAVYVDEKNIVQHATDSPLLWIGFNLVDREKGSLGPIEDVLQTGSQWLARISYQGKEALIPLVPELILDVNTRNRYVRVALPEGLLDVYL